MERERDLEEDEGKWKKKRRKNHENKEKKECFAVRAKSLSKPTSNILFSGSFPTFKLFVMAHFGTKSILGIVSCSSMNHDG